MDGGRNVIHLNSWWNDLLSTVLKNIDVVVGMKYRSNDGLAMYLESIECFLCWLCFWNLWYTDIYKRYINMLLLINHLLPPHCCIPYYNIYVISSLRCYHHITIFNLHFLCNRYLFLVRAISFIYRYLPNFPA